MRSARFTKSNFPREGDAKYRDLALIAQDIDEQMRALETLRQALATAVATIPPLVTVPNIVTGFNLWALLANDATSGDPPVGCVTWNNSSQVAATVLKISHQSSNNLGIIYLLGSIVAGDYLLIQDQVDAANYQLWEVVSVDAVVAGVGVELTVTFLLSGGTGTTNFAVDTQLFIAKEVAAPPSTISTDGEYTTGDGSGGTPVNLTPKSQAAVNVFNYSNFM